MLLSRFESPITNHQNPQQVWIIIQHHCIMMLLMHMSKRTHISFINILIKSCLTILIFSIVMIVASIYCIVIIYIPSIEEQHSTILPEPKRCVTTEVSELSQPRYQNCHNRGIRIVSARGDLQKNYFSTLSLYQGETSTNKKQQQKANFINHPPKPVEKVDICCMKRPSLCFQEFHLY